MTRATRAGYFLTPMFVCVAVHWRAPFIWFRLDDFAWLSLPQEMRDLGLIHTLFTPKAQGTVRVLSERVLFLVLTKSFGFNALPFRFVALGTWFASLVLIQLIGARLTNSRAAGLIAAVLWTISATLVSPLAWASSYNEVLCAFFLLSAFYARLRWIESGEAKWRLTEAGAYLLGFGALELIVVYPILITLHAAIAPEARKRWVGGVWMFAPAVGFGLAHLYLIPKTSNAVYRLYFDRRLISDLFAYVLWTVGPSRMELIGEAWRQPGVVASKFIAAVLAIFALWKMRHRDFTVLFMAGWFAIVLAPVLPLANHMSDNYPINPGIGLAWLAGWAIVSAWRSGMLARALALLLVGIYGVGSVAEVDRIEAQQVDVTARMRMLFRMLEVEAKEYPGSAFVLRGVSEDLFLAGFREDPFRLIGIHEVWLAPGDDQVLQRKDLDGVDRFRTSPEQLAQRLARGEVRSIKISGTGVRDITEL
jgi:hypothetical protein